MHGLLLRESVVHGECPDLGRAWVGSAARLRGEIAIVIVNRDVRTISVRYLVGQLNPCERKQPPPPTPLVAVPVFAKNH